MLCVVKLTNSLKIKIVAGKKNLSKLRVNPPVGWGKVGMKSLEGDGPYTYLGVDFSSMIAKIEDKVNIQITALLKKNDVSRR